MSIVTNMTITISADDDYSWAPTDATGIYSTGTITLVNNSDWMTGCSLRLETEAADFIYLSSIDGEGKVTMTLGEIFPGQTLEGNYLKPTSAALDPVRLLICAEAEDEPLPAWSETITAGTTIKASHMTELQTAADILRARAGLAGGSYTPAIAGETSLALWSTQIAEIRSAIDEIGTAHDTWIDINVNCPSAAVMNQLREIMETL